MPPPTQYYDPTHPLADWSGFIPPITSKKHPSSTPPALITQLTTTSSHITPTPHAPTSEWSHPRLRVSLPKSCPRTSHLIGGPGGFTAAQWETEAQSAMMRRRTGVDCLTDGGRAMHVRGVKEVIPAFLLKGGGERYDEDAARMMRCENPYLINERDDDEECDEMMTTTTDHGEQQQRDENDLVGYRVPRQLSMQSSFLEGIGKEISKTVADGRKFVSSAPYATDGDLRTDPYDLGDGRRKDMLLENYSSVVPGYTGKRQF